MLSACLVATLARAQDVSKQSVDIAYNVDSALLGCPSAIEFRTIVADELGYDPYRTGSNLKLAVHVRPNAPGIDGTLNWSIGAGGTFGERRFTGKNTDCRQLMTSMGFAVAVQLQLMASEGGTTPIAQASNTEAGAHSGAPPIRERADSEVNIEHVVELSARDFQVRSPHPESDPAWGIMAGVGPSLAFGLAPAPLAQGRIFFNVQRGWIGLELGAEAGATSTTRQTYGGGFQHALRLGTLAACAWQGSLAACGVVKLGRIQVQGIEVNVPASPNGFIAQTGPRLAYALGLGEHLFLLGHVEGLWLLKSWTVNLNHAAVWSMPRLAAIAGIDLAVRFP